MSKTLKLSIACGVIFLILVLLFTFQVGRSVERQLRDTTVTQSNSPTGNSYGYSKSGQGYSGQASGNVAVFPKLLFSGPEGMEVWQNGKFVTVSKRDTTKFSLGNLIISPDRSKFIYGFFNSGTDGGPNGMFGSAANTLELAAFDKSLSAKTVGQAGTTAKWSLAWSPNNQLISYVVNDGQEMAILDINQNKVVQNLKGKDTSPVAWLGDNDISFVQDNKLYRGTIANPRQTTIAEKVENSLCTFESPPDLVAPNWSRDHRYVGYYTVAGYVVKDTSDSKTFTANAAKPSSDEICSNNIDVRPIGWDNSNNFYFVTNQGKKVMRMNLPDGKQQAFVNTYAGGDSHLVSISPDGAYMMYDQGAPGLPTGHSINRSGDNGEVVCHGMYDVRHSEGLAAEDAGWSVKYPGTVALTTASPQGYVITVYDIKNCHFVNSLYIPTPEDVGGVTARGMEFFGIE